MQRRRNGFLMSTSPKLLELSAAERESLGVAHTLREILQQPQTWHGTYERVQILSAQIESFLTRAGLRPQRAAPFNVLLVGAGSSDYIGKSVCALLQKEWSCNVQAVPSTDLLTNMDDHILPDVDYLWISFSRSGDSSEGVAVLEQALTEHPRIKHIVITCNQHGALARLGNRDHVLSLVLDDAVNDRGLAMTSSFSNMVIAAQVLAHFRTRDAYGAVVESLAAAASLVLPQLVRRCQRAVDEGFARVCFLGSGPQKAAAIESALKVMELTAGRVVGLSVSFLGLRHGPLSAIDPQTLVVAFLSTSARRRAFEVDLVQEICDKKLTEKCLIIAPTAVAAAAVSFGDKLCLELPEQLSDLYLPPLFVLVGQLLGLSASVREGLRPDAPSPHGAIRRVVTHVTIH
jgi:tagatose-6-phosphate ketose/aldose isomerase